MPGCLGEGKSKSTETSKRLRGIAQDEDLETLEEAAVARKSRRQESFTQGLTSMIHCDRTRATAH